MNTDGRREILGLGLGPSESAVFWLGFLRGLEKRGLKGIKLVISDTHEGLKAAIAQVFKANDRVIAFNACDVVYFMYRELSIRWYMSSSGRCSCSPITLRHRRLGDKSPINCVRILKLAAMMDEAEADVIAYLTFPKSHLPKPHSITPIERLNKEVKRRADVVGIFPNEASITRLVPARIHIRARDAPQVARTGTGGTG